MRRKNDAKNKSRLHRKPIRRINLRPKPALFLLRFSYSTFFPHFSIKFGITQSIWFVISFSGPFLGYVFSNFLPVKKKMHFFLICFLAKCYCFLVYLFADLILFFPFFGTKISLYTWFHFFWLLLLRYCGGGFCEGAGFCGGGGFCNGGFCGGGFCGMSFWFRV